MARLLAGVLLLTAFCWTDGTTKFCDRNCSPQKILTSIPIFRCLNEAIGAVKNNGSDEILLLRISTGEKEWWETIKSMNLSLFGVTDVEVHWARTTEDQAQQLVFMEAEIGWPSLKLVMDAEVTLPPQTIPFQREMIFDHGKVVTFTKSWLVNVSSGANGSLPLQLVTNLSHPIFHPTAALSLDGEPADIPDISTSHLVMEIGYEETKEKLYECFQNHKTNITSLLQQKADRWFDHALPKCAADPLVTSFYRPPQAMVTGLKPNQSDAVMHG